MTGKCYVCEGTEPGYFNRCEKHNVCLSCGTHRSQLVDIPWGKKGGFICKPCEEKRVKEKIEKFQAENIEEDEFFGDDIICPYCGTRHEADGEDGAFYEDGEHDFTCDDCGHEFEVSTYVSFSYTSTRKPDIKLKMEE